MSSLLVFVLILAAYLLMAYIVCTLHEKYKPFKAIVSDVSMVFRPWRIRLKLGSFLGQVMAWPLALISLISEGFNLESVTAFVIWLAFGLLLLFAIGLSWWFVPLYGLTSLTFAFIVFVWSLTGVKTTGVESK